MIDEEEDGQECAMTGQPYPGARRELSRANQIFFVPGLAQARRMRTGLPT